MRRFLAVLLVGAMATAAGAQTSAQPKTKDPPGDALKIAGKTFEQWVKELATKDPSKRETAVCDNFAA